MHFDWSTLALQTVNFVILAWLLHRFLYRPVMHMVDTRRAEIARNYAEARAAEATAKGELAAIEAARAGITAERAAQLKAAAEEAEQAVAARHTKAESEATVLLGETRKTLANERKQALAEARLAALDLGAEFAARLVAELPITPCAAAWIERIVQYLGALPHAELALLTRQLADGAPLRVVTASALPADAAETWRSELQRILGDWVTIGFAADPRLLAGAELYFPAAILRFSLASTLAALRTEIGADGDAR
jgi:F-type H+-transporting ATPase subunit b